MIIKSVKLEGFKGFDQEVKFDFSENKNLVIGHNGKGKTSILESIPFTLFGRTLDGRSQSIDDIFNQSSSTLKTEVTIEDPETYEDRTFTRIKKAEGGYDLFLEGKPITQNTINDLIGDPELFLSIFSNPYYMSLPNNKKREILEAMTPKVDYLEILKDKLPDISLVQKYKIDLYDQKAYKTLKDQIDKDQKIIDSLMTEIDVLSNQNLNDNLLKDTIYEKEEQESKEQLDKAVKAAQKKSLLLQHQQNNAKIQSQIETLKQSLNNIQDINTEELDALNKQKSSMEEDLNNLISSKINKNLYPKQITLESGTACPTCYQVVAQEYILRANEAVQVKIQELDTHNAQIDSLILKLKDNINTIANQTVNLNNLSIQNNQKKISINNQIVNLQQNLYQFTDNDNAVLAFDESLVDKIKENYEKIKAHNDKSKVNNALVDDHENKKHSNLLKIDENNKHIQDISLKMQEMKTLADAVKPSFLHKKAIESKMEFIKEHLVNVEIELYREQKNGEWAETFDIYYKSTPFRRLSFSEQLRCGLEISNMFNKITGQKYPIFVDNTESIYKLDTSETSAQVFQAQYVQDKELAIIFE